MKTITTDDVYSALRARYTGREWAIAAEVGNGTGMACNRRCDLLAMSLWPSKGLHLHGHEIKVSRSDWLREIQDPSKAEAFSKHCHFWWIVAPKGVVKLEELPTAWGLMNVLESGSIRIASAASIRTDAAIDYSLLAAIMRAVTQQSTSERALSDEYQRGYREGYDRIRKQDERDRERREKIEGGEFDRLKKSVEAFESSSGIRIGSWNGQKIGEAVAFILRAMPESLNVAAERIERESASLAEVAKSLKGCASSLGKSREP